VATYSEVRNERKRALREVRKKQRTLDTQIERMERTLFRLLERKTILQTKDAVRLADHYTLLVQEMRNLEQGLTDFNTVVQS